MKNQYVGDINDYKKYTLIEIISEVLNEKILFAWMLTDNDGKSHGNKLGYLKHKKKYREFNPDLFDKLESIDITKRKIGDIENILGAKYNYYSETLYDNEEKRTDYIKALLVEAQNAGLVFFDPDNGIEVKSVKFGNKNSSKYLYLDEIPQFADSKKDILIYQHFPLYQSKKDRILYIEKRIKELQENINQEKTKLEVLPIATENVLFLLATKQGSKLDEIKRRWHERINLLKKNGK